MSRAFAEAWMNRPKNSRFWGVRRSAIRGRVYQIVTRYETANQIVQARPAVKQ
jgi:hypothetical protein